MAKGTNEAIVAKWIVTRYLKGDVVLTSCEVAWKSIPWKIHVCYHVGYHNHYHPWSHLQISCNIGLDYSLHRHGKKVMIIIPRECTLKVHPKKPMWKCTTIRYCWSLKLPPILKMIVFKFKHLDTILHWKSWQNKPLVMIWHMRNQFSRTKHQCSNSTSKKKTKKQHKNNLLLWFMYLKNPQTLKNHGNSLKKNNKNP